MEQIIPDTFKMEYLNECVENLIPIRFISFFTSLLIQENTQVHKHIYKVLVTFQRGYLNAIILLLKSSRICSSVNKVWT